MFQEKTLNIKAFYFTFALLILYSITAYFLPEYLGQKVFMLDESIQYSNKYSTELKESIKGTEQPLTKEMALLLVSQANSIEIQKIYELKEFIELMQRFSLILFGLILTHIGVTVSFLRAENET